MSARAFAGDPLSFFLGFFRVLGAALGKLHANFNRGGGGGGGFPTTARAYDTRVRLTRPPSSADSSSGVGCIGSDAAQQPRGRGRGGGERSVE